MSLLSIYSNRGELAQFTLGGLMNAGCLGLTYLIAETRPQLVAD